MTITYLPLQLLIDLPENRVVNLVLENPQDFTEVLTDLQRQFHEEEGAAVLSENNKELKWEKTGTIITDYINLSVNDKKVINRLYKLMQESSNEDFQMKGRLISNSISVLEQTISLMRYDCISYDLDFSWSDFYKAFHVRINDDSETLLEKLINYLRVCSGLLGYQLLCLVNAKDYLTKKDIAELYQIAEYLKIHLLMVESRERNDTNNEIFYIVDYDHCLIIRDARLGENQFEV